MTHPEKPQAPTSGEEGSGRAGEGTGDGRVLVEAGGQDDPGATPVELWKQRLEQGEQRLSRRPLAAAATGLVRGFDVMIGVAVSTRF
jgi:hypothetical protein